MNRGCKAQITINSESFTCSLPPGHLEPHKAKKIMGVSRVSGEECVEYYGFGWDIDDGGVVVLNMNPAVAAIVFQGIDIEEDPGIPF